MLVEAFKEYEDIQTMYVAFTEVSNRVAKGAFDMQDYSEDKDMPCKFNPDYIFTEVSNPTKLYLDLLEELHKDFKIVSVHDVWNTSDVYENRFLPDLVTFPTRYVLNMSKSYYPGDRVFLFTNPALLELKDVEVPIKRKEGPVRIFFCSQGKVFYNEELRAIKRVFQDYELVIGLHPNEKESDNPEEIYNSGATFMRLNGKLPLGYDLILGKESTVQQKTTLSDIPTVVRNMNESDRDYALGSRIRYSSSADVLRLFLYWDTVPDLDLSCIGYSEDFKQLGYAAFTNLKDSELGFIHSGDITNGEKGGAEFIDIDVAKALSAGVRYITMDVRVYSSMYNPQTGYRLGTFNMCNKCYVGLMERKAYMDYRRGENTAQNGNIYDPSTVLTKMDIKSGASNCQPIVIDLKEQKLISLGLSPVPEHTKVNWIGYQSDLDEYLEYAVTTPFMSIYDLISLHCKARDAEMVDSIEDADIVFDLQQGITPYDLTVLATDWL